MLSRLVFCFLLWAIVNNSYGRVRRLSLSYLPGIQAVNVIDADSKEKAKYSSLLKGGTQENSFGISSFSPIFVVANGLYEFTPGVALSLDAEFNRFLYQLAPQAQRQESQAISWALGVNFYGAVTQSLSADFGTSVGIKSAEYSLVDGTPYPLSQMTLNVWIQVYYMNFSLKLVNSLAAIGMGEVNGLGALKDSSFFDFSFNYHHEITTEFSVTAGAFVNHDHTELFGSENPAPLNAYMIDDLSIGTIISVVYEPI